MRACTQALFLLRFPKMLRTFVLAFLTAAPSNPRFFRHRRRVVFDANLSYASKYKNAPDDGAAGRGRTGTVLPPRDFKSLASAYSATAACQAGANIIIYYHPVIFKNKVNCPAP